MNGKLMTRISAGRGMPSTLARSMETPVTPPSMKRLDSRNPWSPIPAERMPNVIRAALRNSRVGILGPVVPGSGGFLDGQARLGLFIVDPCPVEGFRE